MIPLSGNGIKSLLLTFKCGWKGLTKTIPILRDGT